MDTPDLTARLERLERGRTRGRLALLVLAAALPASLLASPVPTLTAFSNGTVADADEVNANFDALSTAIERIRTIVVDSAGTTQSESDPGYLTVTANGDGTYTVDYPAQASLPTLMAQPYGEGAGTATVTELSNTSATIQTTPAGGVSQFWVSLPGIPITRTVGNYVTWDVSGMEKQGEGLFTHTTDNGFTEFVASQDIRITLRVTAGSGSQFSSQFFRRNLGGTLQSFGFAEASGGNYGMNSITVRLVAGERLAIQHPGSQTGYYTGSVQVLAVSDPSPADANLQVLFVAP